MNNLEITKLCAAAVGIELLPEKPPRIANSWDRDQCDCVSYDPLHDESQALMLIEVFHIALGWNDPGWGAFRQDTKRWVNDDDLKRCVCLCVAAMQKAKT